MLYDGGGEGARTPDLMAASHALSQLSYTPNVCTGKVYEKSPWRVKETSDATRGSIAMGLTLESNCHRRV